MKKTLLEMTQDILSDMTDDEVNSIDDSFESQQVAQIIRSSYENMIDNRNWPHLRKLIQFNPASRPATVTHMLLADSVKELSFINYDSVRQGETRKNYQPITWLNPDEFLRYTNPRNSDSDDVSVIRDPSGVELLILTDKAPTHYTSFDDDVIVFDSYDKTVDSAGLQENKIQAMGYVNPTWTHIDEFVPDLPAEAFSALINEAKSACMLRLMQTQDPKAEAEAQRQQSWLSRKAWRVNGGLQYPDYGRVPNKGYRLRRRRQRHD